MTPPPNEPEHGLNAAVAAELRAELGRQRISVQALATKSGVAYGSLRRYLNAERHIDLDVLHDLAAALHVAPADLVRRAQPSEEAPSLALVADEGDLEPGDLEES